MKNTSSAPRGQSASQPASKPSGQPVRRLFGRRASKLLACLAGVVWLVAGGQSAMAAGNAEAGEQKAWTCLGCHGVEHYVNVYPSYHVPRIAGQHAEYLISALQSYRGKLRAHPTMQANAGLLTDQDIEDIAAWFASQGDSAQ